MFKKIIPFLFLVSGSFIVCHAQQQASDTIRIKPTVAEPLYVLDGKIVKKDILNTIDRESIQQIDVLKGESAMAIYGQQGKSGVIVITTKKQGHKKKKSPRS